MDTPEEEPETLLCTGVRISERIEIEREMRETQEHFISFMENVPAYTYLKNTEDDFIYCNPAVKGLLDPPKENFTAKDILRDEESYALLNAAEARLISGEKEIETIEYETVLGDRQKPQRIRETIFPVHLADGGIHLGGIAFDISETHAIEEQLNQARKMQAIGELVGGIAHDFNNQLSGILGYAALLTKGMDDPEKEKYSQKLVQSIERASDTTRQLLNFSRKGTKEAALFI